MDVAMAPVNTGRRSVLRTTEARRKRAQIRVRRMMSPNRREPPLRKTTPTHLRKTSSVRRASRAE